MNPGENKEPQTLQLKDLVRPNEIQNYKTKTKINEKYYRALTIEGFPRTIENTFISNIITSNSEVEISLRINPYKQNNARKKVRKQLTKLKKDKNRKEKTGQITESIDNRIKDIEHLHNQLDKGNERLFDISLNIVTAAENPNELKKKTEKAKSEMNKQQLIHGFPKFKMLQALKTCLPTTKNKLSKHLKSQPRSMPTKAAAELFPFAGTTISTEKEGILLGENLDNNQPVLTDFYQSQNPNWIAIGRSGTGKSFTAQTIINRYASKGVKTFIIDPHGEYQESVQNLDGENIELSIKKGNMINPLDMMGNTYREKINSLQEFFEILFNGISPTQKNKLVKALRKTYKSNDIYKDRPDTWNNQSPKLGDLYHQLKKLKKIEDSKAQKRSYNALIENLDPYVNGAYNFLDTKTRINVDSHLISFDIEELPENCYPEMMYLLLNFLHSQMRDEDGRKMIVIDEAWELLGEVLGKSGDAQSFIFRTVKTSRKYDLSLGLIVQEIHDLVNSREGKSVLANTSNKLVLGQDRSVVDDLDSRLNLNNKESELIRNASTGECLLLKDDLRTPLRIHGTKREKRVIEEEISVSNDGVESGSLPDFDVVHEEDLDSKSLESVKDSLEWDSTVKKVFSGQFGGKKWVHVPGDSSVEHQLLVYGFRDWLVDDCGFVDVSVSKHFADIEIRSGDNLFGIEVETGVNLKHNRPDFLEKVDRNDERYDDWIVVATNKGLAEDYEEFVDSVLVRTEFKNFVVGNWC